MRWITEWAEIDPLGKKGQLVNEKPDVDKFGQIILVNPIRLTT